MTINAANHTMRIDAAGIIRPVDAPGGGELAATSMLSQVTQYGVTWFFDGLYEVGQFYNGDYFVINPGGGVGISSITPTPVAGSGAASMLNYSSQDGPGAQVNGHYQPFYNPGYYYDASLNVTSPVLNTGDSLLSTTAQSPSSQDWMGRTSSFIHVGDLAVLTCLGSVPFADTFRPAWCDDNKTLYRWSDVNQAAFLNLDTTGLTPPDHGTYQNGYGTVDWYIRGLQRPWMQNCKEWPAAQCSNAQGMPQYHRDVGEFYGDARMFALTDWATDEMRLHLIQSMLDTYWTLRAAAASSATWRSVVPYLGAVLNDSNIINFYRDTYPGLGVGGFSGGREARRFEDAVPWTNAASPASSFSGIFEKQGLDTETRHPSTWTNVSSGDCFNEQYRVKENSQAAVRGVFALMYLDDAGYGCKAGLDLNYIYAYTERWMEEDFKTNYLPTVSANCTSYTLGRGKYDSFGVTYMDELWARDWFDLNY